MNEIKNSILKTLAYFDIFNYPLNAFELYNYLWGLPKKVGFGVFFQALSFLVSSGEIQEKNGYYFLKDEKSIEDRESKVKIIENKLKIAKKGAKLVRYVPFAKAVFVCNTVASGVADKESDVDLFIVVKTGRIWLTRIFITVLLSFCGLRRTKRKIKDKLCLSFYITDDNLDLSKIKIEDEDVYLCYWINQLLPIYDPDNCVKMIIKNNKWLNGHLANFGSCFETDSELKVGDNKFSKKIRCFFEKIWGGGYGDLMENQARSMQQMRMKLNKNSLLNEPDTRVMANDKILKFHECDRRKQYKEEWIKNYSGLVV